MRYGFAGYGALQDGERAMVDMLAPGVTPAPMGMSQKVVDALAAHNVIPRYDVNASSHVAPEV